MIVRNRVEAPSPAIDATTGSTVIIIIVIIVFSGLVGLASSFPTTGGTSTSAGRLFYTQIGAGVVSVAFSYDTSNHSLSLGTPSVLVKSLPGGSDGLVFDPANGELLVGVNEGGPHQVNVVNVSSGTLQSTISAGTSTPSHMMIDPTGTIIWSSADPGPPISIPANLLQNGTVHTLSGDDTRISTIAWEDQTHAFYTSSGAGGNGHFGVIDLTNFRTTCAKSSTGTCQLLPAAHGMAYDPFTHTLIVFGGTHITQIDPTTLAILSDIQVPSTKFDQGTVDGLGHLFVANNGGTLFFDDYSSSGRVGDPSDFTANRILPGGLDDVAPLIGPGSASLPTQGLAPGYIALIGAGLIAPLLVVVAMMTRKDRKAT